MMRAWLHSFIRFFTLTLIFSLAHVEVQASAGNNDYPPALKSPLAVNNSTPSSSQTLRQPLTLANGDNKPTASATTFGPTSSAVSVAKTPVAAEKGASVASNRTTTGSGSTVALPGQVGCGVGSKRSWIIRGRSGIACLAPGTLEPATGLVPDSDAPSEGQSKSQPATKPEPEAAQSSPQTVPQQTESQQAVSQQAGSQQASSQQKGSSEQLGPQQARSQQAGSQQAGSQQAGSQQKVSSQQLNSQQTSSPQTDSQQPNVQQTNSQQVDSSPAGSPQADTQPAKGASSVDSQSASPNGVPVPANNPIIVQGQTVPANGAPITVNNQPVAISSGYIYVGTSSSPIPEAQVTPPPAQPIVAGTLTFQPAPSSPVAQVVASPFVVGGLTFSAAVPEPSSEADSSPDQSQARPVVVGGKMYAPIPPNAQSGSSQEGGNAPEVGNPVPSTSQEPPKNAVGSDHNEPDGLNSESAPADAKPIVIGGTTYTPVTATATPSPAVFSLSGTALTQGGDAVTISGTRISLGPSGVVIGTSSLPFSTLPAPTTSLLTIGSETLTALRGSGGGFEIAHSTLLPGSSGVTIGGTIYSINNAGSLIVGTSTIALATVGSSSGALTAGGETFTPLGSTAVVVNGATLSIGGAAITEHGTRLSLASGSLVVGTSIIALATGDSGSVALTAGGETFTPVGSTAVVVNGATLSIGGAAITENGTRLSLASNGLVVGSSTFAYATPVVNTAVIATGSATFATAVLPSGGATRVGVPSATSSVYSSGALAGNPVNARMMMAVFMISISLPVMIGIM